jgi:hypothetical protein
MACHLSDHIQTKIEKIEMEEKKDYHYFIITCKLEDREAVLPIYEEMIRQRHYVMVNLSSVARNTIIKKVSKRTFMKITN